MRAQRGGSRVFLVALQELDGNALRSADEADAYAGPDRCRWLGELDAFGLDLGGDGVDVLYRQPEMVEALIRRHRRGVDAVSGRNRCDGHVGATELDVDSARAADDLAAQNIGKPSRGRFRIGTAQVDMVPSYCRHIRLPKPRARRGDCC